MSALVLPGDSRPIILSVAHESFLAGYFSHRKTEMKIAEYLYWPGMGSDIRIFCRSCAQCQSIFSKGRVRPVLLQPMLHKVIGVKPIFTAPFHFSGNGKKERLHGHLKTILHKLCVNKPREWHRYLILTLFGIRDLPSDRTGFSAFELLYSRSV